MAAPPNVSRTPAIQSCVIGVIGGIMAGGGGTPNSFMVPTEMYTSVATMRRTLSIRAGQGDGAGSKIDMELLLSLARRVVVSEVSRTAGSWEHAPDGPVLYLTT